MQIIFQGQQQNSKPYDQNDNFWSKFALNTLVRNSAQLYRTTKTFTAGTRQRIPQESSSEPTSSNISPK